jgi:ABC-type uncharacterized transport system auxiliary subunit
LTPDYLLATEIREFEARYVGSNEQPPSVTVAWSLSLVKMPGRQMANRMLVTESAPASRNSIDSVVEAFDVAVGKGLERSVAWTIRTMSG